VDFELAIDRSIDRSIGETTTDSIDFRFQSRSDRIDRSSSRSRRRSVGMAKTRRVVLVAVLVDGDGDGDVEARRAKNEGTRRCERW